MKSSPSNMNPKLTTAAGQRRLLQRLAAAHANYDTIVATNPEAAEAGDNCVWHDNFAYEENQRRMHAAARTIHDLRTLVSQVQVVPVPRRVERVGLGVRVRLERGDTGAIETWTIAGIEDGELDAGRVSYTAPFARALLGAEAGETRVIVSENKRYEVTVLSLEGAPEELQ